MALMFLCGTALVAEPARSVSTVQLATSRSNSIPLIGCLFHTPFMNSRRKTLGQLNLQPQAIGFHRLKRASIVAITLATKAAGIVHRFPVAVFAVKQLPRFRETAFAHTSVIEPVHLYGRNVGRLGKIVLNPFLGAFVRPP